MKKFTKLTTSQKPLSHFIAATLLGLYISAPSAFAAEEISPPKIEILRKEPLVKIDKQHQAIELQNADIETTVSGRNWHSKITLTLHNPNDRVLEGELILPLAEGIQISGFALDIEGEMRPAVPVEKVKGRQVFEDTIRQKVDPALLEKTVGNNYRLRLYPLPANGERKVELTLQQTLKTDNHALLSDTPLTWLSGAQNVKHKLSVLGWQDAQLEIRADGKIQPAKNYAGVFVYDISKARKQLNIRIDDVKSRQLLVTKKPYENQLYLYAEVPVATLVGQLDKRQMQTRPDVKKLSVIWDASLSGLSRDTEREIKMLSKYIKSLADVEVNLHIARNDFSIAKIFNIKNGDISALTAVLSSIQYDGASRFANWQVAADSDAVLVFTDGLETLGTLEKSSDNKTKKEGEKDSNSPLSRDLNAMVKFVTSNESANTRLLLNWAQDASGAVVKLTTLNDKDAQTAIATQYANVTALTSDAFAEVNLANTDLLRDDVLIFTAKATSEALACYKNCGDQQFSFNVKIRDANGKVTDKTLKLKNTLIAFDELAPKLWADMRIEHLNADPEKNKFEIIELGKKYHRVTDFTSLIVLDNLNDYVHHRIAPPADMRKDYDRLVSDIKNSEKLETKTHLDMVHKRLEALESWWKKDYPKNMIFLNKKKESANATAIMNESADEVRLEVDQIQGMLPGVAVTGAAALIDRKMMVVAEEKTVADSAFGVNDKRKANKKTTRNAAKTLTMAEVKIKAWSSEQSYIKALEHALAKSDVQGAYAEYFKQRDDYLASPSFYLDIAEFFYKHGADELATRVLTNLTEISNDNRQLLRVLAYRLSQAKHNTQAIAVLEKIKQFALEEPQSWRDLGLAYADAKSWQNATDNLWHVISRPWDTRFSDIDMIALNEFNHIVATQKVDTSNYDARLIKSLPIGMRVVLAWDTDNSDMDLWVTDPNGEKVLYDHPSSRQGGRISRDFTGGYGPEEFMLKAPKAGKYKVEANFYGTRSQKVSTQTTLQLRFYQNFGRKEMTEKRVMLRLEPKSQEVFVGEFEVE